MGGEVDLMGSVGQVPHHRVGIDPVGVGAAAVNAYREMDGGHVVVALNGAARPIHGAERGDDKHEWFVDANDFKNLRSQMAWQLREDLRRGQLDIEANDALWGELLQPRYELKGGKVVLEPKDDIRSRTGGKSPNLFDALMYANWVRRRAIEPDDLPVGPDRYDPDIAEGGPVLDGPMARPNRFAGGGLEGLVEVGWGR